MDVERSFYFFVMRAILCQLALIKINKGPFINDVTSIGAGGCDCVTQVHKHGKQESVRGGREVKKVQICLTSFLNGVVLPLHQKDREDLESRIL